MYFDNCIADFSPSYCIKAFIVTQTYQAQIYVTLRPSVLDPAGTAVQSGLEQLGYNSVGGVRIGKYVELTLKAADEEDACQQLDKMCDRLLANPTIENYRFDVVAASEAKR